ncbi:MAG: adenosylcobinamide amidohydrolase [Dehalococcoides mccartyi]|nr:adenosylcobinamide amidohydrolase [Dehalococcoides mccartyi]MDP4279201.1 adenosylcobinamide amidohydrolase [Dehalococcoides mccartyi]
MTEVNRRDFLKAAGVGAAGLGVAAAGSYWNSYHEGQSAFSMQGQEHRQGHEYFNREPFRVDKVTPFSWEVIGPDLPNNHSVGGIHRIDMRWYYGERFKSAGHAVSGSSPALGYDLTKGDLDAMPNTWPSNGLAGLSTFYQEYYDLYPMMVDIDKEYKYDWLPQLVERFQASIESRANFNANEGLIAMARSEAQRAVPVSSITAPPEENDWSGVSARRAVLAWAEESYEEFWALAFATAGVKTNAMRIGCDAASGIERNGKFEKIGTINIILLTGSALETPTLASSYITLTEAKNVALQELDIRSAVHPEWQATGTGTDQIISVSGGDDKYTYVGGHTKLGEMMAKAATQAVKQAVRNCRGY